jgi:protein-serine/threonine kinase
MASAQAMGRSSPMPPVPSVAQSNIGQPGQIQQQMYQQQDMSAAVSPSAGVGAGVGVPGVGVPGVGIDANGNGHAGTPDKGPDYVYFERRPQLFSEMTRGKATAAKMKLELYYKEAVEGVVGRKERYVVLCFALPCIALAVGLCGRLDADTDASPCPTATTCDPSHR